MGFDLLFRPSSATRPLSVLLAEDEAELRELLARGLEADGAEVTAVATGALALSHLEQNVGPNAGRALPDVVVSDVNMPGKSGMDLLRELRRTNRRIPVVLITAFGEAVDAATVHALGAAIVLEKPFDFDDLRTALRNLDSIARRR